MPSALYNLSTGIIGSTVNPSLSDARQIAALEAQGTGVIEVGPNINGSNAMVDLDAKAIAMIAPTPLIPNLLAQLAAAHINSGAIPSSAFHPATLAEIHTQLVSANMTGVKTSPAG